MLSACVYNTENQTRKADPMLKHSFYNVSSVHTSDAPEYVFKIYF